MSALDNRIGQVLRAIPITCLGLLFSLLFINVIARTFQLAGFAWFDEVVQGLFAWMVFIGAAALWRDHDHFQVTWLADALPRAPARVLRAFITVLSLFFLVAMTWYGLTLTLKARALTPILDLPTALFYAAIPTSGAIMIAYSLVDLLSFNRQKDTAHDL